ncbi:MAG: trypsin-like peptidase domain-containing protein [Candidatus Saccharimonadales bacterium]
MNEDSQQNGHDFSAVQPASIKAQKQPRRIRLRAAIIGGVIASMAVLLLAAGGMSAAYLLGKGTNAQNNIEGVRQTVVQEGEAIADVAQKVSPSVVSILTEQQATLRSSLYGTRMRTSQAAGTGVIIDANGLILTNKHVVAEGTSAVSVVTSDGVKYADVQIIGRDPLNDLAILKVTNPKDFKPITLGDSDKVRTGQKVIAIGNALGQFQNTVTSGIISGMGRPVSASDEAGGSSEELTNLFQTDAAINSGNSGGPLLNFNGEMIGINTAVAADAQNIGFAIPVNEAKGIVTSAKTTGKLTRPYIGVQYVMLNAESAKQLGVSVQKGAYISKDEGSVVSGSPAEKSGIRAGDIITAVNSTELSETVPLVSVVGRYKVGDTIELTIIRGDKEQKLKVTLAEAPSGS